MRVAIAAWLSRLPDVRLLPSLREELAELKAGASPQAQALVFPTTNGRPIGASNLRRRVLRRRSSSPTPA